MQFFGDHLEILSRSEHTRREAEIEYARNPLNAENLAKWGGALLELCRFEIASVAKAMRADGISKLEEALGINPTMHNVLWRTGNAYTSHAINASNSDEAQEYFAKATECFKRAVAEDPDNDLYRKSLYQTPRTRELHMTIQNLKVPEQAAPGGAFAACSRSRKKMKADDEFKHDVPEWIMFAVGLIALLGMAKSIGPPLPST